MQQWVKIKQKYILAWKHSHLWEGTIICTHRKWGAVLSHQLLERLEGEEPTQCQHKLGRSTIKSHQEENEGLMRKENEKAELGEKIKYLAWQSMIEGGQVGRVKQRVVEKILKESSLAIWYLRNDNKRQSSTFCKNSSDTTTYMQKICLPAQPVHHIAYLTGESSYVLCKRSAPSCPPPMLVSAGIISRTTNDIPMQS